MTVTDLSLPLNDEEIDRLERFLLDRIDEEAVYDGMEEGIFDIAMLDGFLTAIVSGPTAFPPSTWLPVLWGDFEPEWESEAVLAEILSLLMRHMNTIAQILMEFPEDFEPLMEERLVDGQTCIIADEWCEGYQKGVVLATEQWMSGGDEMADLLAPILAFTTVNDWSGHDLPLAEAESIKQTIAPNVRAIHAYWLERREEFLNPISTMRRDTPKVGRNDPCPCGSGKKYKKCCLH